MANTLNLGDGNWGVKDSSLLGYAKDNTKFLPETFDVTRASSGTRVNKAGLIETVEEVLSGELVTNGDFSDGATDWTLGGNWSVVDGKATSNASGLIQQSTNELIIGETYKTSFEITEYTSGSVKLYSGSGSDTSYYQNTVGTHAVYFVANGGTTSLYSNSFIGSIDNISIVQVEIENLARIDYTDGPEGVLLTEPQSTNTTIHSQAVSDLEFFNTSDATYTVTDNYTTSPDGEINASRYQVSRGISGGSYSLIKTGNIGTGDVTISFYAKSLTGVNQNLLSYIPDAGAGEVFVVTSEWKRFVVSGNQATNNIALIGTRGGSGDFFNGGDQNLDIAVWGIQTENLSYATSYMPTYGQIASRAGDVVNNGGDVSNFNSEEGTLFIEAKGLVNGGGFRFVSLSSSSSNRIRLGFSSTANQISVLAQVDGSIIYNNGNVETSVSHNDVQKLALTYGSSGTKLYSNGVLAYSNVLDSSFVNTFTSATFDDGNSTNPFYGKTKNIQVFNEALTDAELITLTTI